MRGRNTDKITVDFPVRADLKKGKFLWDIWRWKNVFLSRMHTFLITPYK
jgi:hypothetical protein